MIRRLALILGAILLAGCGSHRSAQLDASGELLIHRNDRGCRCRGDELSMSGVADTDGVIRFDAQRQARYAPMHGDKPMLIDRGTISIAGDSVVVAVDGTGASGMNGRYELQRSGIARR